MVTNFARSWRLAVLTAALLGAATYSLVAQVPAGDETPAAPAPAGRAGQAAPAGPGTAAPAGRGRGNRGGGPNLGGPQADDPAYVGVDFSKKDPVVPLTPAEEAKHFWLQPGFTMTPVLTDPGHPGVGADCV